MNIRPLQYPSTLIQSRNINTDPEIEARIAQRAAPDSFSWLGSGVITSVKNQVMIFIASTTRPRLQLCQASALSMAEYSFVLEALV